MIKIRLARGGRTHRPVYTIVAADTRMARNGRFIEKLGKYDPHASEALQGVNEQAISKWVNNGAQLTDTVRSLLKRNNIKLS